MITGSVSDNLDAIVPLVVSGESGQQAVIKAVIDTGFNGFLTLPPSLIEQLEGKFIGLGRAILADGEEKLFPLYEISVLWDDQFRTVEADSADTDPLIGMELMKGYTLRIEVNPQGTVLLEKLSD